MGSNKCGMAITGHGLVWKNDWATRTTETVLDWSDLLDRKHEIEIEKYNISFGKGARLNMSGSSMKKTAAFHLFTALIQLLEELGEQIKDYEAKAQSDISKLTGTGSIKTDSLNSLHRNTGGQQELFEEILSDCVGFDDCCRRKHR